MRQRLRILDINTPWFWFLILYKKSYGEPFIELTIWKPHTWQKWWLYAWQWEEIPSQYPMEVKFEVNTNE